MVALSDNQSIPEISPQELQQRLNSSDRDRLQLLDVREPQEVSLASLEEFRVVPLSQFRELAEQLLQELDPHAETIAICHHGMRSAQLCQWLQNQGFTNVKNVAGGIDAYARMADPSIPRY